MEIFSALHLDLTGGHVGVGHGAGRARTVPSTATQYSNFSCLPVSRQLGGGIGVHHHLGQAVAVAQVEETDPPVIAVPVHPAVEGDASAGVFCAKRAAGVGSFHGLHGSDYSGRGDGVQQRPGAARRLPAAGRGGLEAECPECAAHLHVLCKAIKTRPAVAEEPLVCRAEVIESWLTVRSQRNPVLGAASVAG